MTKPGLFGHSAQCVAHVLRDLASSIAAGGLDDEHLTMITNDFSSYMVDTLANDYWTCTCPTAHVVDTLDGATVRLDGMTLAGVLKLMRAEEIDRIWAERNGDRELVWTHFEL